MNHSFRSPKMSDHERFAHFLTKYERFARKSNERILSALSVSHLNCSFYPLISFIPHWSVLYSSLVCSIYLTGLFYIPHWSVLNTSVGCSIPPNSMFYIPHWSVLCPSQVYPIYLTGLFYIPHWSILYTSLV